MKILEIDLCCSTVIAMKVLLFEGLLYMDWLDEIINGWTYRGGKTEGGETGDKHDDGVIKKACKRNRRRAMKDGYIQAAGRTDIDRQRHSDDDSICFSVNKLLVVLLV